MDVAVALPWERPASDTGTSDEMQPSPVVSAFRADNRQDSVSLVE